MYGGGPEQNGSVCVCVCVCVFRVALHFKISNMIQNTLNYIQKKCVLNNKSASSGNGKGTDGSVVEPDSSQHFYFDLS